MTPYSSFLFFIILGILLAPTIILGLNGKSFRLYNMLVSVLVLALIFSNSLHGLIMLCLFTLWQTILIKSYIAYRREANSGIIFCLAAAASILPLALSKLLPFFAVDNWATFLGISYLTFKGVQLIIETRDGLIKKQLPISRLLYFILFFQPSHQVQSTGIADLRKTIRRYGRRSNTKTCFTKESIKFFSAFYISSFLAIALIRMSL